MLKYVLFILFSTYTYKASSSDVDVAIGYSNINLTYNSDLNLTCAQYSKEVKFFKTDVLTNETTQISYDKHKYIYNAAKSILTIKKLSKNLTLLHLQLVIIKT